VIPLTFPRKMEMLPSLVTIFTGQVKIKDSAGLLLLNSYCGQQPKHNMRRYGKEKPRDKCQSNGDLEPAAWEIVWCSAVMQVSCKQHGDSSCCTCSSK